MKAALAAVLLTILLLHPAEARRTRHVSLAPVPVAGAMVDDRYPNLRMPEAYATARARQPARHRHHHRAQKRSLVRGLVAEVHQGAANTGTAIGGLGAVAARWLGGNPTGWRRAWCGNFMRLVVRSAGLPDNPGGNLARNWSRYGSPSGPQVGAIGVMPHHVGIVIGHCRGGGILLRSGNHRRRVADGCYSPRRFIAFRSAPFHRRI